MNLSTIRCPGCETPFDGIPGALITDKGESWLQCTTCGATFLVTDDNQIVHFISKKEVKERYPEMELQTRSGAKLYDALSKDFADILGIDSNAVRREYLGTIDWPPASRILDVGAGTGSELEFLCRENPEACKSWVVCGIDISIEMLRIALKKLRRRQLSGVLFVGFAERLPFNDGAFDIVFHTGSINEFHDQGYAIREMVRVAKPGGRILITDEWMTQENVRQPIGKELARAFPSITVPTPTPFCAVPTELLDDHEIKTIWGGYGYCMSLRKKEVAEGRGA